MKRNSLWLSATAILVLLWIPAFAFDFSEVEKSVSETTLDNGLKIIVMERHDAPVASFVTYANVGGVDDPKEYTGLAHMFEHMAFKGTTTLGTTDIIAEEKAMAVEDSIWALLRAERKKGMLADSTKLAQLQEAFDKAIDDANQYVKPNEFDHILETQGAVGINAGTGKDMTQYIMSLPSNKLELWMAMESERFLHPVLREMYRERNVIAEERKQTLENNPIMRTIDAMASTAFSAHPYGISIVGHMSDIQNYNRAEAEEFFKKYYIPSNMILAIVGDVDPKEVFKLAKKYWGRIPSGPKPEPVATVEPPQNGKKEVDLHDPAQPLFAVAYHIPAGTDPDWPVVQAIADYLGQGRTSLLYKNLVKDKKIAADVGVYAGWPGNKYPSLAFAYAMPAAGHTNEECEEQVLAEIDRLKSEPIPAEELEKIKARATAGFVNGLRSNLGMAIQLASFQNDFGDWRALFRELDRIKGVTPEDVQRVAKEYFNEDNETIARLNTVEG